MCYYLIVPKTERFIKKGMIIVLNSNLLKAEFTAKGYTTQRAISKFTGWNEHKTSDILTGKRTLTLEDAEYLCDILDIKSEKKKALIFFA